MKLFYIFLMSLSLFSFFTLADNKTHPDISSLISKSEFLSYKDVGEFIDHAPKVTITVKPAENDIVEYGPDVIKTITGSDCDRDGQMDDNKTCNAVYYKLWLMYQR
ncbi:hypothetical protein ACOYR1_18510 [Thalassotalea piscium]